MKWINEIHNLTSFLEYQFNTFENQITGSIVFYILNNVPTKLYLNQNEI